MFCRCICRPRCRRRPCELRQPVHRVLLQRALLRGGGVSVRARPGGSRHRQHVVGLLQRLPLRGRAHPRLLADAHLRHGVVGLLQRLPLRGRAHPRLLADAHLRHGVRRPGRPARDAVHGRVRPLAHELHEPLPQGDAAGEARLLRGDARRQPRARGGDGHAPRRDLPHPVPRRRHAAPLRRPPVRHPQLEREGRRAPRARMRRGAGGRPFVFRPPAHEDLGRPRILVRTRVRP